MVSKRSGLWAIWFAFGSVAQAQLLPLSNATQVATGGFHSCLVTRDGAAKCWGLNSTAQMGDGGTANRLSPVDVAGLGTGVANIAAGFGHSCAVTSTGAAKCWGLNGNGQLGDGSTSQRATPVDVAGLSSGVRAIAVGRDHSCALTLAGAVKCWGLNGSGQLGDGSITTRLTAVDVVGLASGAQAIAVGDNHGCAVVGGGIKCWGSNSNGQLGDASTSNRNAPVDVVGLSTGASAVSAGSTHSCAVTTTGAAKCWGSSGFGQLGAGNIGQSTTPIDVVGLATGVQSIAAGRFHSCAVSAAGAAKCWGRNFDGQLGDGAIEQRNTPVDVSGLGSGVQSIAAGGTHSCALLGDGTLRCWGSNGNGELGDGTITLRLIPVSVTGLLAGVQAIEAARSHTCAVAAGGVVKCWGGNLNGELGDGSSIDRLTAVDTQNLGSGVLAVATGQQHACAVTAGGGVRCWGQNFRGQLGDGSSSSRLTPVAVTGLDSGVVGISVGTDHSCALTSAGAVQCWGFNLDGQLGDGTTTQRSTPVNVTGLSSGVQAISLGSNHSCALLGGGVKCWGGNAEGQLGDGGTAGRTTPTDAVGLGVGVAAISAGNLHSCARMLSGGAKCWGDGAFGQLGDGGAADRPVATDVSGLATVQSISAGGFHSCAVAAGAVRCWGFNSRGQLGDGSRNTRLLPTATSGLGTAVLAIDVGREHSCALLIGGAARCWGRSSRGQIGDGGADFRALPAPVLGDAIEVSGASGGNLASFKPVTDASGRFVVFESNASTLAAGDSNGSVDVFRRDTQTGVVTRVSVDNAGAQISGASIEPAVAANGARVLFVAADGAVNKLAGESERASAFRRKGAGFGVFLRNLISGTTQRVATALPGGTGTEPQIAADGAVIAFTAANTDSSLGAIGQVAVFVVPLMESGGISLPGPLSCPTCKTVDANGRDTSTNADGPSRNGVLSADGAWLAWETQAKNSLAASVSPCPNASAEIILRNLISGTTQRVSAPSSAAGCGTDGTGAHAPSMDFSGLRIAFESDQPLKPGDANSLTDVFLFEARGGGLQRLSESLQAHDGNGASNQPIISGDGSVVAFRSSASNLEPREADDNELADIHVRRIDAPNLRRISGNRRGDQANGASGRPALNYAGTSVAFDSDASNLVLDPATATTLDSNAVTDVFQRANPTTADVVYRNGFE